MSLIHVQPLKYKINKIAFDPDSGIWTTIKTSGPVPSPRAFFAAISIGHILFIYGGYGTPEFLHEFWSVDLSGLASKNERHLLYLCQFILHPQRSPETRELAMAQSYFNHWTRWSYLWLSQRCRAVLYTG